MIGSTVGTVFRVVLEQVGEEEWRARVTLGIGDNVNTYLFDVAPQHEVNRQVGKMIENLLNILPSLVNSAAEQAQSSDVIGKRA